MFGDGPGRNALPRRCCWPDRAGRSAGERETAARSRAAVRSVSSGRGCIASPLCEVADDEELDCSQPRRRGGLRETAQHHKSKGLEFPIVVLAGWGQNSTSRTHEPVLLSEQHGLCPKITPAPRTKVIRADTWLARRVERRELRGEEMRLFYVALTRARDTLILVGTTNRKADASRWLSEPPAPSPPARCEARSHLDWLVTWLSRAHGGRKLVANVRQRVKRTTSAGGLRREIPCLSRRRRSAAHGVAWDARSFTMSAVEDSKTGSSSYSILPATTEARNVVSNCVSRDGRS